MWTELAELERHLSALRHAPSGRTSTDYLRAYA
jgi:hypothetical protein